MVRRGGIVLILVSGLVTVIALLGAMFVRVAGFSAATDAALIKRVGAKLAIESGLSYAGSRLGREAGYPVSVMAGANRENRGDDWEFRDGPGTALRSAVNPSYSHGESWVDADLDGMHDPGEAYPDTDGNGRFDARSGRLRTSGEGSGISFFLKIIPSGALFPVNASGGQELARLGDNLGSVLFPAGGAPERVDRSYTVTGKTGEEIRISALGRHLIFGEDANGNGLVDTEDTDGDGVLDPRENDNNNNGIADPAEDTNRNGILDPAEDVNGNGMIDLEDLDGDGILRPGRPLPPAPGYTHPDQVRAVLASFGYTTAQIEIVLPFLDFGPYETPITASSMNAVTINLSAAPRGMLEAFWLYASFVPSEDLSLLNEGAGGLGLPYGVNGTPGTRSGGKLDHADGHVGASVMLYPDEVERLVDWVEEFRRTDHRSSWFAFRAGLVAAATPPDDPDALFFADTGPLMAAGWTHAAWGWARAKADAAFFAACREGSCSGWGIDHGPTPIPFHTVVRPFIGVEERSGFSFPSPAATQNWPGSPYKAKINGGPGTCAMTLAPPTVFGIEALAGDGPSRAVASGRFRAAEKLEFTCQEDFENTGGGWPLVDLSRYGITVQDVPFPQSKNLRRRFVSDSVANLVDPSPALPFTSSVRGAVTGPVLNPHGCGPAEASRSAGYVALAGKHTTLQDARLYWGFLPDDTPEPGNVQRENEWKTQTRLGLPPPEPDTLGKAVSGATITSLSPWATQVDHSGETACTPFNFPPMTNGSVMGDFAIEFLASGTGQVFLFQGDTVKPHVPGDAPETKRFRLEVIRATGRDDATAEMFTDYTVVFEAPSTDIILIGDDDTGDMIQPPLPGAVNHGHYKFRFTPRFKRIDLQNLADPTDNRVSIDTDHVLITVENKMVPEWDVNGNGQWDAGDHNGVPPPIGSRTNFDDWNDDDAPGDCRNLTFTVYVNGIQAGTGNDIEETFSNFRPRHLRKGRPDTAGICALLPSDPGPTQKCLYNLVFRGDELKFYDYPVHRDGSPHTVMTQAHAQKGWELGRFVLPPDVFPNSGNPEFLSPAYRFEKPVRVICAGWTGLPAGDPSGAERVGMAVKVGIPRTGPMRFDGPRLGPTEALTDEADFDAALGPVNALGYSVEFESLDPSDDTQLYATPFFEGIWMVVQGNNRSPAWISRD